MTCITGMVRNGHVYMAGDLMGSNGFTGKVYPDSKVFVNGDFIIGYTSSFRMGQILEWNWNQPLRQEGICDREYMQLNVVESLRETFAAFGYGVKDGLEDIGGNFLIGYKDKLYEMQNNFSLLSIEDYAAVGSGSYHAEAILHLLYENEEIHPFEIMETAIGTAAHFTQSVSRECTVFSTDEEANEAWQGFLYEQQEQPLYSKEDFEDKSKEEILAMLFGEDEVVAEEDCVLDDNVFEVCGETFQEGEFILTIDKRGLMDIHMEGEPPFTSFVETQDEFGLPDLKRYADLLGVKFPHNIGQDTLAQKLDDKVKEIVDSLNQ